MNIEYLTDRQIRLFFSKFYPNFPISPKTILRNNMSSDELQRLINNKRNEPAYVLSVCSEV